MRTARTLAKGLDHKMLGWLGALAILLATQLASAQPPVCSSGCLGACTLTYNADGVVRDNVTGQPIAGAQITLLDAAGTSAADGTYSVNGSRPNECHFDYFFSLSVTAPGYEPFSSSGYWTGISLSGYEIRLNPMSPSGGHVVSGIVTEFPPCSGAMRGVTVILEPLNITTVTSADAGDGGRFAFRDVPPGHYTIRVVDGCNPFGCWDAAPVRVDADNVTLAVCMTAVGPGPSPTPTPTAYAGPTATFTVCPAKTPCVLGERPRYCEEHCGLGCGREPCPDCPAGFVSAPRFNTCECIPGPDVTPGSPTPTPLPCLFPTPPLCPVGQTAYCPPLPCGSTDAGCFCGSCPACADGLIYSGEPNRCECVDPHAPTRTPTPTPSGCPARDPDECSAREYLSCGPDCSCACLPCAECPEGLELEGVPHACTCVDLHLPSRTPTTTPPPIWGDTPAPCPTRTPLACPTNETTVCDTSINPCGICNCRAVPQEPADSDSTSSPSSSSGGCAIASTGTGATTPWSWSLLLIALVLRSRKSRPSFVSERDFPSASG